MFKNNAAAFVHDLAEGAVSNVNGESNDVRVQVLTNAGALDREKQQTRRCCSRRHRLQPGQLRTQDAEAVVARSRGTGLPGSRWRGAQGARRNRRARGTDDATVGGANLDSAATENAS